MKLVNLTPHELTIHDRGPDGEPAPVLTLPPSGVVARVASETRWGHPGRRTWYGTCEGVQVPLCVMDFDAQRVTGLPPEDRDGCDESGLPRTGYVVSLLTWLAIREEERADVFAPGPEIRDESGRITGCDGLIWDFAGNRLSRDDCHTAPCPCHRLTCPDGCPHGGCCQVCCPDH